MHTTARSMDIFELSTIITAGDEVVLKYFQHHGLLRQRADCVPCGRAFTLVKDKVAVTGYMLHCPGCRKKEWLTKDSFFAGAHLSLHKLLAVVYFWTSDTSVGHCAHHVGVSCATFVQWYQYFRDVCSWKLLSMAIVLGGVGKVVQIDESVMVKA